MHGLFFFKLKKKTFLGGGDRIWREEDSSRGTTPIAIQIQAGGNFRLCLVLIKFEGKCKGKKIQKKNRRKEKVKENKKLIKS